MINAVNLPRGSHAAQISIFPRSAIIHRLLRLLHDSGPQALQAELSFRGRRRIFPLLCLLVPVSLLVCCSFTVLLGGGAVGRITIVTHPVSGIARLSHRCCPPPLFVACCSLVGFYILGHFLQCRRLLLLRLWRRLLLLLRRLLLLPLLLRRRLLLLRLLLLPL